MTCKDCVYYEVCKEHLIECAEYGEAERILNPCSRFKNKVDFIEVKHAEWRICCDGWYPYCSNCSYEPERPTIHNDNRTPYCPNCGAKMKLECDLS